MNSDPSDAAAIEKLVNSNPTEALTRGREAVESVTDDAAISRVYRSMSIAARRVGTIAESIEYGRRSVDAAARAGSDDLRLRAQMTLAGSMYMAGSRQEALVILEAASSEAEGLLKAEIEFQIGAVLARSGDSEEALQIFSRALPVFRSNRDLESEAMTLQNRGMIHLYSADLHQAHTDLEEARGIYERLGDRYGSAGVIQNLGVLASYEGRMVDAHRLFEESEAALADDLGHVAEIQVARCDLLLSMGLFSEARSLAAEIANRLDQLGLTQDRGEALLVAAHAALLDKQPDEAVTDAEEAKLVFEALDERTWTAHADYLRLAGLVEQGVTSSETIDELRRAATHLAEVNHFVASFNARLSAAKAAIAAGDVDKAVEDLQVVAGSPVGPVETRLQSSLAKAQWHELAGNRRRALTAARSGMRLLDDYQAALGASDVRAGIERHTRDLTALGLRLALDTGRSRTLFGWMELAKARSIRFRPVAPPQQEDQAADLAELRRVSAQLRDVDGSEAIQLRRLERDLQESIRTRNRAVADSSRPPGSIDIASQLGNSLQDRVMVQFAEVGTDLHAIEVRGGRFRSRRVGPAVDVMWELRSLRFLLRRASRLAVDDDRIGAVAERLDGLLFSSLGLGTHDDPVVVVPTPELYSCPWSSLPTLQGRPVVVAPSAETWLRADSQAGVPKGSSVVSVAGPRLEKSEIEANYVFDIYGRGKLFEVSEAAPDRVLSAMEESPVAHIASHAILRASNPMFSALVLSDGDLFVYDIERLRTPPTLVVLSACDSGFSETDAGSELLGLSAALLAMGTKTVVASVGLVPDSDATNLLMRGLHTRIAEGKPPSVALHAAQDELRSTEGGYSSASAFVCIGAG